VAGGRYLIILGRRGGVAGVRYLIILGSEDSEEGGVTGVTDVRYFINCRAFSVSNSSSFYFLLYVFKHTRTRSIPPPPPQGVASPTFFKILVILLY